MMTSIRLTKEHGASIIAALPREDMTRPHSEDLGFMIGQELIIQDSPIGTADIINQFHCTYKTEEEVVTITQDDSTGNRPLYGTKKIGIPRVTSAPTLIICGDGGLQDSGNINYTFASVTIKNLTLVAGYSVANDKYYVEVRVYFNEAKSYSTIAAFECTPGIKNDQASNKWKLIKYQSFLKPEEVNFQQVYDTTLYSSPVIYYKDVSGSNIKQITSFRATTGTTTIDFRPNQYSINDADDLAIPNEKVISSKIIPLEYQEFRDSIDEMKRTVDTLETGLNSVLGNQTSMFVSR